MLSIQFISRMSDDMILLAELSMSYTQHFMCTTKPRIVDTFDLINECNGYCGIEILLKKLLGEM